MNAGRFLTLMLLTVPMLLGSATSSFPQSPRNSAGEKRVNATGQIELEHLARNGGRQSVTLTILNIEEPLQYERYVTQAGQVQFHLKPGQYIAVVRGAKWLAKRVLIDARKPHVTFSVLLLGGDANGDNRVDFDDLDILASAFESKRGAINWDERADLDCDGRVDDADADIMFANLFTYGD